MKGGHNEMTQNQIAFVRYMEDARHNKATEELTKYTADLQASTTRYVADLQASTNRYVAELQSATSIKVAKINQATAITTASISAAATRYAADVNSSTQRAISAAQLKMNDKISKRATELGYFKANADFSVQSGKNFISAGELMVKQQRLDSEIALNEAKAWSENMKGLHYATNSMVNVTKVLGFNSDLMVGSGQMLSKLPVK